MTISEVSQTYDISVETLRYYERIGLIPPVNRNQSGIRNYQEIDCNWVQYVKCMRNAGLSIESLIEYTMLFRKGIATIPARKQILIEQREQIAQKIQEMQTALHKLDEKIDGYEEKMIAYEENNLKKEEQNNDRYIK